MYPYVTWIWQYDFCERNKWFCNSIYLDEVSCYAVSCTETWCWLFSGKVRKTACWYFMSYLSFWALGHLHRISSLFYYQINKKKKSPFFIISFHYHYHTISFIIISFSQKWVIIFVDTWTERDGKLQQFTSSLF